MFLENLFRGIKKFLWRIRKFLLVILAIGLPLFIYFGFIAKEPVFDVEYDVLMGRQSVMAINQDTIENPVLSPEEYPEAYEYLRSMTRELASSSEVKYAEIFKYDSVQLIHRDDILNAFCLPGGYIYVYTGIIHYLDNADDLAGVLGHEIAHAEQRHSAIRLQKEYGRERILDFILVGGAGLPGYLGASILKDMLTRSYSRDQEAEADRLSVYYLRDTDYSCKATASFFQKLLDEGNDADIPEFLSDHPASVSRVRDINKTADELDCDTATSDQTEWLAFKALLPKPKPEETPTDKENPETQEASGKMEEAAAE